MRRVPRTSRILGVFLLLTACELEPEVVPVQIRPSERSQRLDGTPVTAPTQAGAQPPQVDVDPPGAESGTVAAAPHVPPTLPVDPPARPRRPRAAPQPRVESVRTPQASQAAEGVPSETSSTPEAAASGLPTTASPLGLNAVTTLARPTGPVEIEIMAPADHGELELLVLDREGRRLAEISVVPGRMDVLALVPELGQATRTTWVQLAADGTAVGSPLWITPLRGAPAVRTVPSTRPGTQDPYTRIVGWGDRALDPTDPQTGAVMGGWSVPDPVVTSGYRVEPAVDARLVTSEGSMLVALAPDAAPATVENFLRLARSGFLDRTIFHRVVPMDREGRPFVIQGGDPTGTGDGGPGWNLAMEPSDLPHDRGVLGMARGDDPDSAGSQFYVSLSREGTARLDGQYCTFGWLREGFDTLDRIAATPIGDATTGRPKDPPLLERVELVPAPPRVAGTPALPAMPAITPSSPAPMR